jgi:hypothetical protein
MRRTRLVSLAAASVFAVLVVTPSASAATTRYVAPDGSDAANDCTDKKLPCQTVQHAVDVADPGDTISIDKGTYAEQVTISEDLTLRGKGEDKTIIKAPAVMSPDAEGKTNIIELDSSAVVDISKLTVAGPMPMCGNSGIAVIDDATLNIDHAAVRDIGPLAPNPACMGNNVGEGIRAGTQRGGPPQVGHVFADHIEVTNYNRNGIVVVNTGSTGSVDHSEIETVPNMFTVPNGVVGQTGGVFTADHNKISGNQCTIPGTCGPNFQTQTQSGGYLIFDAAPGVTIEHSDVRENDVGIWVTGPNPDMGHVISRNHVRDNLYGGLVVNGRPTTDILADHNHFDDNGDYGIWLGNTTPGGTYDGFGTYTDNHAKGHSTYDLYWDGTGAPTFDNNHCGTAFPSEAAWDC